MSDGSETPLRRLSPTGAQRAKTLGHKALHEFQELAILTAYLYVTLGTAILLKTAELHAAGVAFAPWGIAIVKALVLAKFILIGNAAKIGERFTSRPLAWATLEKAVIFLLLLIVLTILEEVIVGLFHHRTITDSLGDLFGARLFETLAGYVFMLLVLVPYFAFRVLGEALGRGRLFRMFFVTRNGAGYP